MAKLTLKRLGNQYVVLDGDEAQVAGPMSKAAAEAFIGGKDKGAAHAAPASASPFAEGDTPADRARERAWSKKVDADLRKPRLAEEADLKALLLKRHSEDETDYILRQIMPIVIAGLQGGRRERKYVGRMKVAA